MVMLSPVVDAVRCVGLESVTVMVTATGPPVAAVGVPLITPVLALIDRPAGRPAAEYVYGAVPPLAVSDAVYETPTTPVGSGALVIVSPVGLIVIVSPVVDAVRCVGLVESVAVMVTATG